MLLSLKGFKCGKNRGVGLMFHVLRESKLPEYIRERGESPK